MSLEQNKALARRFREDLWNVKDLSAADDLLDAGCILHVEDPITPACGNGPAALKQMLGTFFGAFPDVQVTIEDLIAEGDKVAVYWTARGTYSVGLEGIPSPGARGTTSGIDLLRIADGRVVEVRTKWDALGLLQQLGALPGLTEAGRRG